MPLDEQAWEQAVLRFRPLLLLAARRRIRHGLRGKVDPSDMVQRTLLEAHEKRYRFRGSCDGELMAWLQLTLGHRIIDEIRKLRGGNHDADIEVVLWTQIGITHSPSRDLRRQEEALRLAAALERLPDDQRTAVELRHLDGHSLAEAAALMDRSAPAFAGLLHRGMARLRELLKETQ